MPVFSVSLSDSLKAKNMIQSVDQVKTMLKISCYQVKRSLVVSGALENRAPTSRSSIKCMRTW